MVLKASDCYDYIRQTLGGDTSPQISPQKILNDTGRAVTTCHPWRFMMDTVDDIPLRGTVSVSAGTWTNGTLSLASTGSFANYTHLDGDTVEITGGTGVTTGLYKVASRTDDDTIVLASSISTGSPTDVVAKLRNNSVALPADLQEIVSVERTRAFWGFAKLVTISHINRLRNASPFITGGQEYYVALNYHQNTDSTTGGAPEPRLEIYPDPSGNENDAFRLVYRKSWTDITTDQQTVPIPPWFELCFTAMLRHMAQGWEEHDLGTIEQRMALWKSSDLFRAAVHTDSTTQPSVGPLRGGAAQRRYHHGYYLRTQVAPPG